MRRIRFTFVCYEMELETLKRAAYLLSRTESNVIRLLIRELTNSLERNPNVFSLKNLDFIDNSNSKLIDEISNAQESTKNINSIFDQPRQQI